MKIRPGITKTDEPKDIGHASIYNKLNSQKIKNQNKAKKAKSKKTKTTYS